MAFDFRNERQKGILELEAMQEYGVLYSRKEKLKRISAEMVSKGGSDIGPYLTAINHYSELLNYGMTIWLRMYNRLSGEDYSDTKFEMMLKRKGYI